MAIAAPIPRQRVHPYISRHEEICRGKPVISGTRIKVSQIAIYVEEMGYGARDIVEVHPHLTLERVHDALSYYYENREEIDRQIAEEDRMIDDMKRGHVSILDKKLGANPNLHSFS